MPQSPAHVRKPEVSCPMPAYIGSRPHSPSLPRTRGLEILFPELPRHRGSRYQSPNLPHHQRLEASFPQDATPLEAQGTSLAHLQRPKAQCLEPPSDTFSGAFPESSHTLKDLRSYFESAHSQRLEQSFSEPSMPPKDRGVIPRAHNTAQRFENSFHDPSIP